MGGKPEDNSGVSRRALLGGEFLRGLFGREASVKESGSRARGRNQRFPIHRPPGAVAEELFLIKCTRCDDCVAACPPGAIVVAPARMRAAAGTPMITSTTNPCVMCADTPCITACSTGALIASDDLRMGSATVLTQTCLAYQGSFCTVCSEQCPVQGAIDVVDGKPVIHEEVCTGCGVCDFACPAPHKAILIRPK